MNNRQKLLNVTTTNKNFLADSAISKMFESEYNKQAIDFLLEAKTTCDIELIGQGFASWNKKSKLNKYSVTLKNKNHTYTFDFWGSINNTEKNKKSTYDFYSVLACLISYVPDSFDDFCADFGYEFKNETEYIKVKQTHLDCLEQVKNLKKLFTSEQLEKLSEIN